MTELADGESEGGAESPPPIRCLRHILYFHCPLTGLCIPNGFSLSNSMWPQICNLLTHQLGPPPPCVQHLNLRFFLKFKLLSVNP